MLVQLSTVHSLTIHAASTNSPASDLPFNIAAHGTLTSTTIPDISTTTISSTSNTSMHESLCRTSSSQSILSDRFRSCTDPELTQAHPITNADSSTAAISTNTGLSTVEFFPGKWLVTAPLPIGQGLPQQAQAEVLPTLQHLSPAFHSGAPTQPTLAVNQSPPQQAKTESLSTLQHLSPAFHSGITTQPSIAVGQGLPQQARAESLSTLQHLNPAFHSGAPTQGLQQQAPPLAQGLPWQKTSSTQNLQKDNHSCRRRPNTVQVPTYQPNKSQHVGRADKDCNWRARSTED